MAKDSPWIASYLYYRLRRSASPQVTRVRLRNFMEMEPDPQNRVTLSTSLDEHGDYFFAHVAHACGPRDRLSMTTLQQALAHELKRLNAGRLIDPLGDVDPWPIDRDASHHMGTTRMGSRPRDVGGGCRLQAPRQPQHLHCRELGVHHERLSQSDFHHRCPCSEARCPHPKRRRPCPFAVVEDRLGETANCHRGGCRRRQTCARCRSRGSRVREAT